MTLNYETFDKNYKIFYNDIKNNMYNDIRYKK